MKKIEVLQINSKIAEALELAITKEKQSNKVKYWFQNDPICKKKAK